MKSQGHLAFSFAATGRVVLTVGLWLAVVGQIAPAQTTITVGQDGGYDHETIQAGIDTATTGDTVLVYPGTYVENTKFNGKDIILRSAEPTSPAVVASTIIDGNLSGSVVTFAGSETSDCVLSGFTITNGRAGSAGGILGNNTLATVENCVISSNSVLGRFQSGSGLYKCDGTIRNNMITGNAGNGLFECDGTIRNNSISRNAHGGLYDCDGTIRNNTISGNSAAADGGGLCECDGMILNNTISGNSTAWSGGGLAWCDGTIVNNTISGNSAAAYGGGLHRCNGMIVNNTISGNSAAAYGGGLFWCDGTIVNNTISGNSAAASGGGLHRCNGMIVNNTISGNSAAAYGGGLYRCNGMIRNCIVWGNTQSTGPQLNSCVTPSYCCIQNWSGGGDGNFPLDPRLSDDFHLLPDSPCIDAGGRVALTPILLT